MKKKLAIALSSLSVLAVSGLAFAAEGDAASSVTSSMSTSFQTITSDVLSAMGTIAPIAITIFGAFLAWKLGKKFFSRMTNG